MEVEKNIKNTTGLKGKKMFQVQIYNLEFTLLSEFSENCWVSPAMTVRRFTVRPHLLM